MPAPSIARAVLLASVQRTQLRTPDGWQVPDTIGEFLTDLTELSAPGNRITGLPLNLERCRFAIVSVDLERNRLTALPPVLLRLTRLTRLGLSDNELRELPLELGRLLYLKDLTVPTTDLGSVPLSVVSAGGKAVIRYMCGLEECSDTGLLDFSGMNLDFLPPAVRGTTSALTMLKLDDNPLERVPNWLGEFQRLRRISLRRTPIVRLPATLGAIQSLEEVVVDEGSDVLLSPPPEVVAFGSQGIVSYLRRSYSAVVYRQLDLSGFGLTRIPFQALSSPSVLTSLALNNNALESLPLELAQLHGLKMLALAGNRLASLPLAVFPPLTALRSLSLKDNPLEALPLTLGACSLLEFLDYDAAAIASPPRDVVVKSVGAVRVYLRQAWLGRSTGRLDLSSLELTDVPLEATAWSPLLRPPSAPAPAPASAAASVAKEEGAGAESAADAGADIVPSRVTLFGLTRLSRMLALTSPIVTLPLPSACNSPKEISRFGVWPTWGPRSMVPPLVNVSSATVCAVSGVDRARLLVSMLTLGAETAFRDTAPAVTTSPDGAVVVPVTVRLVNGIRPPTLPLKVAGPFIVRAFAPSTVRLKVAPEELIAVLAAARTTVPE